jgi:UDP-N-acetylmuramoylalanine--D-glutamate ligase
MVAAGEPLIGVGELGLIGPHNTANAMAAAAAALAMGIDAGDVAAGLRSFRGVPHRLERLGEVGGVAYVNDSKATNVAAARAAISSFDAPVHVILGGSSKGERFTDLAGALSANARAAYLIGETAGELDSDLAVAWAAGVERHRSGDLPAAVREAAAAAHAGEVVLLAPACASFDWFRDYAERGNTFKEEVTRLKRRME